MEYVIVAIIWLATIVVAGIIGYEKGSKYSAMIAVEYKKISDALKIAQTSAKTVKDDAEKVVNDIKKDI